MPVGAPLASRQSLDLLMRLVGRPAGKIAARTVDPVGGARRLGARGAEEEQLAKFAADTGPQAAAALAVAADELRRHRVELAAQLFERDRVARGVDDRLDRIDRKSTRLNSSH